MGQRSKISLSMLPSREVFWAGPKNIIQSKLIANKHFYNLKPTY